MTGPTMTTYTAAIATHDVLGDFCDVTVIVNDDSEPKSRLSDELAMESVNLPVRTDDEDVLGKVEDAAETVLAAHGWRVTGGWSVADNALYAPVEREGER